MYFMVDKGVIHIEVAYGTTVDQSLIELNVPFGTTLIEAVRLSGIAQQYPEIDLGNSVKGIFSKIVDDDRVLQEHDRVEIYRSLEVDPKEARRQRAMKDLKTKI
jgi:putative ubiquitin-RnfH superfamily antitoxin RatB of RatAB toxin-antitoxin module